MDDFDIMVPRDHVHAAMGILESLGWNSEVHQPRDLPLSIHACSFRDARDARVDLHWRLRHLPATAEFDRTLWQHALPVTLQNVASAAPSLTDQFLHTCAHGPQFKDISPVRWLPDAFLLLRQAGDALDWNRIDANAPSVGAVHGVRGTLAFLRDHLDASVPPRGGSTHGKSPRAPPGTLGKFLPLPPRSLSLAPDATGSQPPPSLHARPEMASAPPGLPRLLPPYQQPDTGPVQHPLPPLAPLPSAIPAPPLFPRGIRIPSLPPPGDLPTLSRHRTPSPPRLSLVPSRRPAPPASARGVDCKIALDTGSLRSWKTDLSHHLRFTFEGTPILVIDAFLRHT